MYALFYQQILDNLQFNYQRAMEKLWRGIAVLAEKPKNYLAVLHTVIINKNLNEANC